MRLPFNLNDENPGKTPVQTAYAPAERDLPDKIRLQYDLIKGNKLVEKMSNSIAQVLLVLNDKRQIIYANEIFIRLLGLNADADVIGKRPGEAVNCVHAAQSSGGCGTTEFCRTCGSVNAILEAQKGIQAEKECRILTSDNNALDLLVKATPFIHDNQNLTIFVMKDISSEKRKQTLERTFFHDVLNSAGGIAGLSSILTDPLSQQEIEQIAKLINKASENLINEINLQRQLSDAENGDLVPQKTEFHSLVILKDLSDLYSRHEIISGKYLVISKKSANIVMKTDAVLLRRIIGNMIKNALEASMPGSTVSLSCTKSDAKIRFAVHNELYIPKDVQMQLFKRSFSTKGTGRGIGTYSMKLLGEKYLKGEVGFESSVEKGTTFYIDFPETSLA